MGIESFATQPLQTVVPAYLYAQYSDDANMQAFVGAFNGLAQGYLDWFNQNPLGVYTNPNMTGQFLDWVGTELYGIPRQVTGSESVSPVGYYGSSAYTELPYADLEVNYSGSSQAVSDDIYKRFLTWNLYLGDGKQMSIPWLIRRIARFLYGVNGADISASEFQNVVISIPKLSPQGAYGTDFYSGAYYSGLDADQQPAKHSYLITIPPSSTANAFAALVAAGIIQLPFQINFSISIGYVGLTDANGDLFILNQSALG